MLGKLELFTVVAFDRWSSVLIASAENGRKCDCRDGNGLWRERDSVVRQRETVFSTGR